MAYGISTPASKVDDVLQSLSDRIAKLEKPITIHLGPVGGSLTGVATIGGWTLSVASDGTGNLIATSDSGSVVILATP